MENEKPLPLALSGDEVKAGILAKIEESLVRSCHLRFDNAYCKVSGKISIQLVLDDYGREVKDNHPVDVVMDSGLESTEGSRSVEANIVLEPLPPNVFRVQNGLDVPIRTVEAGKQVVKNVRYSPRRAK